MAALVTPFVPTPPQFDPSMIPRIKKKTKDKTCEVRMMLPFSMQCSTCGEFMYRGKKFNSKKSDCEGEDYMGIRRFRFFIKCCVCSQEIVFKTDPKNADYELERGATRNAEAWKEKDQAEEDAAKDRADEERADAMKALENRTLDSKVEMEILDALDEIKAINKRHEHVDSATLVAERAEKELREAEIRAGLMPVEEEEEMIKNIRFGGSKIVRRLEEDEGGDAGPQYGSDANLSLGKMQPGESSSPPLSTLVVVNKKKKRKKNESCKIEKKETAEELPGEDKDESTAGLGAMFAAYASDDSS
jgi:hypothetical protein